MSGGGGSYFDKDDAARAIKELRKAEQKTLDVQLDSAVAAEISDLLKEYNNRKEEIPSHLASIQSALEKDIEGTIDLLYGGSISRNTSVDGLSDVDALIVVNNCELAESEPIEARTYIANRLRERFPRTEVKTGDLAVTVSFENVEVQLVPAVRCENSLKISNSAGDRWSDIKPDKFAKALTRANAGANMKLVPMIKIAKGINASLPENQRLKSYHLEALAIEVQKNYFGVISTKKLLQRFYAEAPTLVLKQIKDKTGQTIHVDEYLGPADSPQRRIVSNALGRIGRRMKNADLSNSLDQWKDILES
jgi:hypothetical protein